MGSYDPEVQTTTVPALHVPYVDIEILEGFMSIAKSPLLPFISYHMVYCSNVLRFTRITHENVFSCFHVITHMSQMARRHQQNKWTMCSIIE